MPKATIKTEKGTEITIDSDRETIIAVIAAIQKREEMHAHFRESLRKRREAIANGKKKPTTATDLILDLKQQGYFKEKRALRQIQAELEKRGYMYPTTTLSAVILRLLRKGELGRVRDEKQWGYVQK